jgi:hypothetical protein
VEGDLLAGSRHGGRFHVLPRLRARGVPGENLPRSFLPRPKQPPDVQKAILQAAKDAEAWNRKAILEEDKGIQEQIRAKGVSITKPDAAPFREATKQVYEDFYATAEGKSARAVVDHILSIK